MNRPFSSLLALCATLLLCFQLTLGQQTKTTVSEKDAALREKAFELLASLADQISTLQSAENRARMGSNIAGSLWKHDEKRARALFGMVEDDIKLGLQVQKGAPNADHTFQVFYKLRDNTAERMAQHDPELALAFLKETFPFVSEYARLPSGGLLPSVAQQEQEVELRLARRIGGANPDVAIKLARQSLANGFSNDLLTVLRRASKDKAQVSGLYKEIVAKLRDADFEDWQTREFAQRLATSYTPPVADESTFRGLIQIFVTKAIASGCTNPVPQEYDQHTAFCLEIGTLYSWMEKFYPFEARRLKHWATERDEPSLDVRNGYTELDELAREGTIEEVLALASKYPEIEGSIRLRAMWMAESAGDLEQAQKIAANYNGDPDVRQALNDRVNYHKEAIAGAEAQFAAAQKNLSQLPVQMQITGLFTLAHNAAMSDKKLTVKMLSQVSGLIDTLNPGREQTEYQIQLAVLYSLAESDRGFAIIEGLLPKLNELIAAGAKLDGYEASYLRDGEWNMSAETAVGNILTLMANNAAYFARYDFDRAVTLAGQFERSEIRMMAQLKLAQGILHGPARAPYVIRIID
jgi:hypothetical protein